MKKNEFLKEIKNLEEMLREKAGIKNETITFPVLLQQIFNSGQINKQTLDDLEKIWEFRNRVVSPSILNNEIFDEIEILLTSLINYLNQK
ncbi:MAG: hypothetical protein US83_C0010G0006 [Candidatus Falkowbacteria bacterium GW2011_GWC2_38_22]|uniref:Uncharacterized protein n=1 Tax=Candidatus Falkowbacteria bacterium GW2011_GWE1_38_31 TaxID=1618638 RepID=A0A0G0JRT5_9BACT|nr:MAG: hypothetical protein US73_C0005G0006 [Candidatus Falkowbacteria bacterium GW2011_GWF2_38_1205]KKQ60972.1 MAG: hypothetical protein US83_C0010G0006 [Candidatus Falkowbacteria bacterium GW2011_GWC2_38_22]KKQ63499.1 MAG: hypothetical protein US84_C0006G0102 [Candidatus Falkowbacteria bacterium GW2011_GWF1_38_22]KKQ65430.1 MAG: hypothetical protein US87_C0007G0006 [Candidatus Falkowbacteria bacterium GW2011_GWE2_38_254]KKQ70263.1 MAG: hypothetical protein US91_C0006G0102 [Candidatus Falkowb